MSGACADVGHGSDDLVNLMGLGQSVITALNEGKYDITTGQRFRRSHGVLPRHIRILHSVDKMHRTGKGNGLPQDEVLATVFDQSHCDRRRFWVVRRGLKVDPFGFKKRSDR